MKQDMVLARRIRGDHNHDYIDRIEKSGDEIFYQLPYRNEKEGMAELHAQVKNMWCVSNWLIQLTVSNIETYLYIFH